MTVALVGAGPGDPGLITVRGLERLRACDALVYDRLVAPELVDEARQTRCGFPRRPLPGQISELLVTLGRQGLDVVRLKGGDPTSSAAAGRRRWRSPRPGSRSRSFRAYRRSPPSPARQASPSPIAASRTRSPLRPVTRPTGSPPDYASLASAAGTLVLFMGLARLRDLADGLIRAGRPPRRRPRWSHAAPSRPAGRDRDARGDRRGRAGAPRTRARRDRRRRLDAGSPYLGRGPRAARLEHPPDPAHGLADPVLVLDEREADEALAARAEAGARRDRHLPSRARCSAKASEPIAANGSGTGAHANIVPRGRGNDQPARCRPSQSASRRER